MLTVGVDLAAQAPRTAVAWVDWSPGRAQVRDLELGADDDRVVSAIQMADKAGIDCPLGWPNAFVSFVSAHHHGHAPIQEAEDWKTHLAYRTTDAVVRATVGIIPLSVSADRIGHTAMRCVRLLARLAAAGQPVDRAGGGTVVEVYPAAALRCWDLHVKGMKKDPAVLGKLVDGLQQAAPWLDLDAHEDLCRRSDDAFDAVIAALIARAAALGLATRPDAGQQHAASTEGWIALPETALDALP